MAEAAADRHRRDFAKSKLSPVWFFWVNLESEKHSRWMNRNQLATWLFLNLGTYANEQRLIDDLFGNNQFKSWSADGGELRLFLDSFDECLLRLDNVASLLADQTQRLKTINGLSFEDCFSNSGMADWTRGVTA